MIAFVQGYGLHSWGGGARILRGLLQGVARPFVSICTHPQRQPATTVGRELWLPLRPGFGRVERSRLGRYLGYLQPLFAGRFRRQLGDTLVREKVTAIHAIPQGIDFWYAFQVAREMGLPYYLNVHDDMGYTLAGRPERRASLKALAEVWPQATGRIVICEAMGEEYCRRYGRRPYAVVTDGIQMIAPEPRAPHPGSLLRVYFMGAAHVSYGENFQTLFQALALLGGAGRQVSLVLRGSSVLPRGLDVPVKVLPWGSEDEIARDLDQVDLLYLPMPFGKRYEPFWRYSLSTKMVTYLGSGLPILYHGPAEAAAARLLARHGAATLSHTLDPGQLARTLEASRGGWQTIAANALRLAAGQFSLASQRARFWALVGGAQRQSA